MSAADASVRASDAVRTRLTTAARRLGVPGAVALVVVALVLLAVVAPSLVAPGSPAAIDPGRAMQPPGWGTWFGTDESGRDVWTRVVHGASSSLGVGLAATAIGTGLALVLGFAAGLGPRWLDAGVSRIIEVLYALPTMVLALLLVAVQGPGVAASVLAVGLATAPGYARILRARARSVADSGYVAAARLEGRGGAWVLRRHILPNALWPLVAVVTLGIGQAVVWVAALSFLGLGARPPSSEWGAMLNAGRVYLTSSWWLTVCPGLAITVTAAALTVLGRRFGRVAA
ncbi:peptide ABC transporter permease [Serinibacter arcticus]|uniref:Peptide ABC transporter permease n=1 Tax=Serinibacter arcticus TaxID=1655435 RepID=A0A2U1ZQU9_9MICO|nr:ABC transporter permease [Serinibacter arcticus]PWD49374.1 peptide ABC transporter permease [Serinibacter arcticus]